MDRLVLEAILELQKYLYFNHSERPRLRCQIAYDRIRCRHLKRPEVEPNLIDPYGTLWTLAYFWALDNSSTLKTLLLHFAHEPRWTDGILLTVFENKEKH